MANQYLGVNETIDQLDNTWTHSGMVEVLKQYLSANGHHRIVAAYNAREAELLSEGCHA